MKRGLKITLITLGSVLASLVVIVVVAVSLLMYVVFTPEQLTPVVRKVAADYVRCEHHLGEVDLTFWSTFPEFGVRVADVELINPMPSAPSDTLLRAGEVVATVDVMALLNDSRLDIHDLILRDISANAYVDTAGVANWEVFNLPEDTTAEEESEGLNLPFDEIHVSEATIASNHLRYLDRKQDIEATIDGFGFGAEVESWEDIRLQLNTLAATARLGGETYLDSARIALDVPVAVALDSMHFALDDASLAINDIRLTLTGWATVQDTISMDLHAEARKWDLEQVIALIPAAYRDMLSDIRVAGRATLLADVAGQYADSLMPIVDAHLELDDIEGKYAALPYKLRDVQAKADAHLDLNRPKRSYVTIDKFSAKTLHSRVSLSGRVDELLGDMLIDAQARADVQLPDVAYFLPRGMQVAGRVKGDVAARIRLSDLMNVRPEKGQVRGTLDLSGIHYTQDGIRAKLPDTQVRVEIPNRRADAGVYRWLYAAMQLKRLDADMSGMRAHMGRTDVELMSSNVLSGDKIEARLRLRGQETLEARMDSMGLEVRKPHLQAKVAYDTRSALLPQVRATLSYDELKAAMSDLKAHMGSSELQAHLVNTTSAPDVLYVDAGLLSEQLDAETDSMAAHIHKPHLQAKVAYDTHSELLPQVRAHLTYDALEAAVSDIEAKMTRSSLQAHLIQEHKDVVLVDADVVSDHLEAHMDSIDAQLERADLKANVAYNMTDTTLLPTVRATLQAGSLSGNYTDILGALEQARIEAHIEGTKARPAAKAKIHTSSLYAKAGKLAEVRTQALSLGAKAKYNPEAGNNALLQWNPKVDLQLEEGRVEAKMLLLPLIIPQIDLHYSNRRFHINESRLRVGNSDFALSGDAENIKDWMLGKGKLKGDFVFESEYADVNQLMALLSADEGSEETPEDKPAPVDATPQEKPAGEPFMVPTDMDIALTTKVGKADIFNSHLNNVSGKLYINDGKLVLDQMGFVCKAASLQLTAMYRTPRKNHIYVGFDYHMLHVDIEELIDMIPQVEEMFPMLRVFKGQAEFHLAAETYTNAKYEPKMSTLRGACSLMGKDVVVLDNETFSTIAKYLLFNKKTENKIDSISAEAYLYKKNIEIYPLCVQMDNYMVALGGQHKTDMTFNYEIDVLKPIYLGLNVSGNLDNLQYKLVKCKFAKDFRPLWHGKVDEESANIRKLLRESMRQDVKIE